jgi:SMI1 / KNR4 family (SUKH-1)
MTEDFAEFLQQCLSQGKQIFVPDGESVDASELEAAESRLGINLPASYKYLLLRCGSGTWCGEWVAHPSELYAFDSDCLQMEGFIPLVHNVRGVGDYVAINPSDAEVAGERPVYYCSHDPFGYVEIAASFEEWAHKVAEAQKRGVDLYASVA